MEKYVTEGLKVIKKSIFFPSLCYKCSAILVTFPKGNIPQLKLLIKFPSIKANYCEDCFE